MKNIHIGITGMIIMFLGISTLILMVILSQPNLGIIAVGQVVIGLIIIFYGMFKPLTDEDFTDEQLARMGKKRITKYPNGDLK